MVPALDNGGRRSTTQADAILQYVAERYSEARLDADDGTDARFVFNKTIAFLTGDFHPAFWPHFTPERFTTETGEATLDAVRTAAQPRIARVLDHLDKLIGDTNYDRSATTCRPACTSTRRPARSRVLPSIKLAVRAGAARPISVQPHADTARRDYPTGDRSS